MSTKPPGPGKLFAIPAALRLLKDPPALIMDYTERYGPVWRTHMPDRGRLVDLVWLMGRDGNERVLAPPHRDDFSWYEGYRFTMEPMLGGNNLILLDGKEHRQRHRVLIPAFHPQKDGAYIAAISALTERRFAAWRKGAVMDLAAELKQLSFHVAAHLLFGAADEEIPWLTEQFEEIGLGLYSVFRLPLPGTRFARGLAARRRLTAYIEERLAQYRSRGELPANMLGSLVDSRDESGAPLPDQTLVAEVLAFLFAGFDTTSSMYLSFWVELAGRPDLYAAIRAEARALSTPSYQAMQEQPMLEATLLETERLHPSLIFCMRGAARDFHFAGFDIAKGSKVAYSPYYTGRQPDLFPRPLEFRPERFLSGARPPPYSLCGFGGGHRACIGKRFATLEMRLLTNLILQRWDLEFLPEQSAEMYYNPTPQRRHGFHVRVC
ncbi:MAG TPA: cytochrome P450 [Pseudomonadota bacterium]|nr:cytochrome P450 [Pseudomonadota bacterium]